MLLTRKRLLHYVIQEAGRERIKRSGMRSVAVAAGCNTSRRTASHETAHSKHALPGIKLVSMLDEIFRV